MASVPVNLDALSDKCFDSAAPEALVDIIWGLTKFAYTGDGNVEFTRCFVKKQGVIFPVTRQYHFDGNTAPSDVGRFDHECNTMQSSGDHQSINSMSSFIECVKQTILLVAASDEVNCKQLSSLTGEKRFVLPPAFFSVVIRTDGVEGLFSVAVEQHRNMAICIADTIAHIGRKVVAQWSSPLNQMDVVGPENMAHLLRTASKPSSRSNAVLTDILIEKGRHQSQSVAIDAWDGSLTYAELYKQSCRLAATLIRKGIAMEERVLICMEKSKWGIVALFGVLLAGGVCVPLDIRYPHGRIKTLLSVSQATYAIVDERTIYKFHDCTLNVVYPNQLAGDEYERLELGLERTLSPSDLAFIYYTSGSTGTPKGVLQEHGGLHAVVVKIAKSFSLDENSRLYQYSSYAFDASIGEILATLARGGCLCIPSEEDRINDLSASIATTKSTHAALTNTVIKQLQPGKISSLKYLFAIGEVLDRMNLTQWRSHVSLAAVYGTTESLVYDTIATDEELETDHRTIGHAIGSCLWVVDPGNPERLKPVGAVGEILIEGPLLARGYLNDLATTADKFVEAPHWLKQHRNCDNVRCYRSGDLGTFNHNGTVSYLGRADTQIKIRGQRVELSEIEHRVSQAEPSHPEVNVEAIVLSARSSMNVLIAFVVSDHDTGIAEDSGLLRPITPQIRDTFIQLRSKVAEELPGYMVPSVYIPISEMPRGLTGKRDRKLLRLLVESLPECALIQYFLEDASSRGELETNDEKLLLALWARVLGTAEANIGKDSHFFQVGGDSIRAIELASLARQVGFDLTAGQLFQFPVFREQVASMRRLEAVSQLKTPAPFSLVRPGVIADNLVTATAQACLVSPDHIEDAYPAAPIQEALMAVTSRRTDAYLHRAVFKIPDSVDLGRFQAAWDDLVSAEAVFRTRIVVLASAGAYQVVLRQGIAWRTGSSVERYIEDDKASPMSYGTELCRHAIIHNPDGAVFFVWSAHHAIIDGWSKPMMFDEVRHIYEHGHVRPRTTYNSFIEHLEHQDIQGSEEFWAEELSSAMETYPRLPSFDHALQAESIKTCSIPFRRRLGSKFTTATLVQAAWALTTATYTNGTNDDVVFGITLSGRDTPIAGIEQMMGATIATVPLRIVIDKTQSLVDFLQGVQETVSAARTHQHVGLQRVHRLRLEACSTTNFHNLLIVHHSDGDDSGDEDERSGLSPLGLRCISSEETDTLDIGLTVQVTVGASTLRIYAQYDEKVITGAQLDCVLHVFEHLLLKLSTEAADTTIYAIDPVSPYDLALLDQWYVNTPPTQAHTLHGLFEAQVAAVPTAPALSGFDGDMTYQELKWRADKVVRVLRSAGVGPEVRVLLCFAKSSWSIITMLAVLKAGGVCVSLNPEHPHARLMELAEEAESRILLCDESAVWRFQGSIPRVIAVNESLLLAADEQETPKSQNHDSVLPSSASFVVFTSGSTGKPKGSVLEHRALCTSLLAIGERCSMNNTSRTLQFSAYTFDIHIWEIFGTLIYGGCVCVISDDERLNRLDEVIHERSANIALLTPTVSRLLTPKNVKGSLETLILSGEPAAQSDYQRWAGHVRLFNGLGPSECSPLTCLTQRPVATNDDPANIGHALACHLWITDIRRPDRLVPIGCVGELTLEGAVVGRGYINRPNETAAAFISDPMWSRRGSKVDSRKFYRTGDLAKLNPDGSVTFVGRVDTQVKIRGQRVELGEIEEHVRRQSSGFNGSIVEVLTVSSRGNAQAVAVFVPRSDGPSVSESKSGPMLLPMDQESESMFRIAQKKLADALPLYMVPSIFFPVSRLPVNASGKLQRTKLHEMVVALDVDDMAQYYLVDRNEAQAPSTPREKVLQSLWAGLLGLPLESIGSDDSFFGRGGDSVLAMALVAAARQKGLSLRVMDVFQTPKLKEMALVTMEGEYQSLGSLDPAHVEPFALLKHDIEVCIDEAARECNISKEAIEDIYPCTATQEALIAASSYRPSSYMFQTAFRLPSTFNLDRFKKAWEVLVATQSIFRTRIVFKHGIGSLQVVIREDIRWITVESSLEEYLERDAGTIVAYGSPLCKFAIAKHQDRQTFVMTIHHAIYDGSSLALAFKEVHAIYQGIERQPLVPHNRFIQYLASVDLEASDNFWRQQFPTSLESFPRLPSQDYIPRPRHSKSIDVEVTRRLYTGVTLANLIQSAWALLLSQYTGSSEVSFGLMLSGRDSPVTNIAHIMGPTVATVPIRAEIDNAMTVAEYLTATQQRTALVTKYQHAGLQHIRRLSPEADTTARFQNLLVMHTSSSGEIFEPIRSLGIEPLVPDIEEFLDLALTTECLIEHGNINILSHYDDRVINHTQVDFMLDQFKHIVSELVQCSEGTLLRDINACSPLNQQQVAAWNSNLSPVEDSTLHSLVEAQAIITPNAIAINSADGEMTYAALDATADKLAAYLTEVGVGIESRVILCFSKSMLPIISMLAILKSGGACVSVNPEHPSSRLLGICQDVGVAAVLCDTQSATRFYGHVDCIIGVDAAMIDQLPPPRPTWTRPQASPRNAAFVVYTSGSTGKPKGCVLEHRSVTLSQQINAEAMRIGPMTRALQYAAYTFDASICEIFAPLICGGCVCIPSDEERMNDLAGAINYHHATWIMLTPTVANMLAPDSVSTLETLVFGGEALSRKVLHKWLHKVHLINYWGPSECSNSGCINTDLSKDTDPMNIGRASGCTIWITEQGNPDCLAPIGCTGELVVGGPMLGRHYVNRAEETATAFIFSPSWSKPGDRFYRTGDLARFNSDGSVTFVGRADTQVEIHGQRVELGEIEFHVSQLLPEGGDVVAELLAADDSEPAKLFAFIRLACFTMLEGADLRVGDTSQREAFQIVLDGIVPSLSERLPGYMMPSAYVPVTHIPTTASAKTERKRLIQFARGLFKDDLFTHGSTTFKQQPTTELERILQSVWALVLNHATEDIGVHDTFMSLGGDSIAAIRAVSECRKLGVYISVITILREKTIATITHHIKLDEPRARDFPQTTVIPEATSSRLSPVDRLLSDYPYLNLRAEDLFTQLNDSLLSPDISSLDNIDEILPLSPFQEHCIQGNLQPRPTLWNCIFFDVPHSVDILGLERSCVEIVRQFDMLRAVFIKVGTLHLQVILKSHYPRMELHDTQDDIEAYTERLCWQDLTTPKVLGTSFLHFYLVCMPQATRLIMRLSHAQFDGLSRSHITEALATIYDGKALRPSPKFTQYVRHVSRTNCAGFKYWSSFLKGSQPSVVLKSCPNLASSGCTIAARVSRTVPAFSSHSDVTPATLFDSACAKLLASLTSSLDVVFCRTVSGRASLDTELQGLVGPCVNIVPIRVQVSEGHSAVDLVESIHRQHLDSIRYETVGLDDIIQNCTTWTTTMSKIPVLTQYLNVEADSNASVTGGALHSRVWDKIPADPFPFTLGFGALPCKGGIEVSVGFPSGHDRGVLNQILDHLCTILSSFP